MKEILFTPLEEMGCDMEIIVGNHDIYYKNTLAVNSMHELTKGMSRITVHNKPTEVSLDGKNTAVFLPWIPFPSDNNSNLLIPGCLPMRYSANSDNANITVIVKCADLHLERFICCHIRRRDLLYDH